jgi:hypothetical protein
MALFIHANLIGDFAGIGVIKTILFVLSMARQAHLIMNGFIGYAKNAILKLGMYIDKHTITKMAA